MRKVMLALLLTAVGLGLLLSFRSRAVSGASSTTALGGSALSGANAAQTPTASPSAAAPSTTSSASSSPSATASSAKSSAAASGAKNGAYTGSAEDTQYGPVQVQATISGGKLTNVTVLQVPDRGGY
ncbi:MAG TPA: hypothetical protein VH372_13615, partial [Actinospica sp.]|nr:hypothetical protein [Actinospica sp.]